MDSYNEFLATNGKGKSLDYSSSFSGGTKFKNEANFLKFIDFCVDVELIIKKSISPAQYREVKRMYMNKVKYPKVYTKEQIDLQSKLGLDFLQSEMYPVSRYFK